MRVLLVNAFHWLKGGVERTYLDESRWLAAAGHEVGHFATIDARNLPSPTAEFFAPPADFSEGGGLSQISQLPRVFWSAPAAAAMERLLASFRPDVAHVHAPSRYLTPSIFEPLQRAGVPVVMTLHDFKPWCTNRSLFARGAVCERCRGGRHWQAFATGCVQHSRLKSAIGAIEAYVHDDRHAYRSVRRWIAPSRFACEKAVSFGVLPHKLRVLTHGITAPGGESAPNALDAGAGFTPPGSIDLPDRYALFFGRLSLEKGVRLLPAIAAAIAPVPLLVAGEGPLARWLDARRVPNLKRLGHLGAELGAVRRRAAVVVMPSLFYETYGYAAAETLVDARPLVAAAIGALPELVEHEVTGLVGDAGDAAGLAALTRRALDDPQAPRWGEQGRARVLDAGNPRLHLEGLLAIYEDAVIEAKGERG